jgi:hypothetical protein
MTYGTISHLISFMLAANLAAELDGTKTAGTGIGHSMHSGLKRRFYSVHQNQILQYGKNVKYLECRVGLELHRATYLSLN